MNGRVVNALIVRTVEGSSSLVESHIQLPEPKSNHAIIRVIYVAQNYTNGLSMVLISRGMWPSY